MRPAVQHRRAIAWLCVVATLLLGLAAQRHALAHALDVVQAPIQHDALLGHAQACAQCLQFAAVDTATTAADMPAMPLSTGPAPAATPQVPKRAERFTAYGSRAPPRAG